MATEVGHAGERRAGPAPGLSGSLLRRRVRRGGDGVAGPAPRRGLRAVLALWIGSRVCLAAFVLLTAYVTGIDSGVRGADLGKWLLDRFAFWDSYHFIRIADVGYLPPGLPCCDQAFFPGYPLAMRALAPLTGGSTTLAGVVLAQAAGLAAVLLLWGVARDALGTRAATLAALFLTLAPMGVFLGAVYTEAPFLALAVGAWWAAGRRRWWVAGILAALASAVRVNGLFLLAGLAVMYAVQWHAEGRRRARFDVLALALAPAVVAGYLAYLHAITGSWNAWRQAEAVGWARERAWPWQGLIDGWQAIFATASPQLEVSRWADLVATVAGLLLLAALLWLRRWPAATYIGLSVAVLVCSTTLVSAPRYALTWFPGYLLVAELATRPRWRWLTPAVGAACLPLLVLATIGFATRHWVA